MYSLVLMTAMATTSNATEFNGFFRDVFSFRGNSCNGCSGCTGCSGMAPSYACYGGCSGSTSCSGCTGCCGGGETFRERLRRVFSRSNCSGCTGCTGCYGGCSGCFGSPTSLGCCGGMPMTAPIMYGTPFAPPASVLPGAIPYAPPESAPAPPPPSLVPDRTGIRPAGAALPGSNPTRGAVIVRLPADARLFAGDRALPMSGGERQFVTPPLPNGQEFTYRFRAEYERDGETITLTKRIAVRAGATASVEFSDVATARPTSPKMLPGVEKPQSVATATSASRSIPSVMPEEPSPLPEAVPTATVAQTSSPANERATLVIRVPAGATLYVDDRKATTDGAETIFRSPPLPAGREFSYQLKAEIIREGRPESLTQKVAFRAGERITVDFGTMGR